VKKVRWRILGSVLLLSLVAWRLDWARVGAAFAGLRVSLWLAAVGMYLLAQVVSSVRWRMMARVLGLTGTTRQYVGWYYIGMFFNLCLPTSVGGDVVRAWYLARQPGGTPPLGRTTSAVVSVFADRLSGVCLLCLLAVVAALLSPVPLPDWVAVCVTVIGAGLVVGLVALPVARRLLAAWPGLLPENLRDRVERLLDAFLIYARRGRVLLASTLLSAFVQVLNAVLVWMTGVALGLDVPVTWYCLIVPLVVLLTLLPVSLNGMGLRELGYVVLLMPVGVDESKAVTLAFLGFAVTLLSSLLGLGFYLAERGQEELRIADCGLRIADCADSSNPQFAIRNPQSGEGSRDDSPVRGDSDQGRARKPPAAA
jgi:uncharacterized protein (TIRG00374 family)